MGTGAEVVVVDEAACCGDRACPCLRETDGVVVIVDGVGADVWTACFVAAVVGADAGVWAVCFEIVGADAGIWSNCCGMVDP